MLFRKIGFLLLGVVILLGTVWHGRVMAANEESALPRVDTAAPSTQSVHIKNTESMVVVFVVPPEKVKNLIPEPLILSPYNIMYVAVSRTPMEGGFTHSLELGIGVTFKGRVYNYPVYRMVDNQMLSEVGRMITGAPTKIGEITLDKKAQSIKATAAQNGKVLFKATMTLGEEGEPLDNAPVVNLKVIPGEKKDAPLLRQLVGGKIENVKVHELIDGECKFEFASSPADGFPEVPVQQIFRSFYRKADFTLTGAGVLHDYLKKN